MNSPNDSAGNKSADSSMQELVQEFITRDEKETFQFGGRLAAQLTGGEVLLLNGTLGAGKTVLVKGLMDALDFDTREVTSPTFTLVNRYDARLTVYHLDLYRLAAGASAAAAVDLEELLSDDRAVIIIEWAERLGSYPLPPDVTQHIRIEGDGDAPRRIIVTE
jgi:tRNA threonylcarbamoyladenosine biosynthesis protein TsaE